MSSDTGSFIDDLVSSIWVSFTSIPDVPSNTCTIALLPDTSSTWPPRRVPSGSVKDTISLYDGNLTFSSTTSGLTSVRQHVPVNSGHSSVVQTWVHAVVLHTARSVVDHTYAALAFSSKSSLSESLGPDMVVRGGQIKCVLAAVSTAAARSVRGGQVRSEIISKTPKVHPSCARRLDRPMGLSARAWIPWLRARAFSVSRCRSAEAAIDWSDDRARRAWIATFRERPLDPCRWCISLTQPTSTFILREALAPVAKM